MNTPTPKQLQVGNLTALVNGNQLTPQQKWDARNELGMLLDKLAALQEIVDADKDWMAELQQQLTEARKEIEVLKAKLPIECNHEWVSSVAYKGARVCSKCHKYK